MIAETAMSGDPIGVAHIIVDLQGGGMETLVAAMTRQFAGTSIRVSVITLSGRRGRIGETLVPRVHQFHALRPTRGVSMILPLGLARCIRATGAQVVHLHSGGWYKGAVAAHLAGVRRIIYTEHGREHNETRMRLLTDRAASHLTTLVVAVSDRLREYMRTAIGVPERRLVTIPNGVDVTAFSPGPAPDALRHSLRIPAHAAVIGSIGRLEPVKAYERIIAALSALATSAEAQERPFYAVICGDGSEKEFLLSYARELGVEAYLRLPGWTDQALHYHRMFDVFVLPSRMEGASVSLMEAMACGTPVVATNVGANAEIMGPDLAHLVVDPGDGNALARTLKAVLGNRLLARELGREARSRIEGHYSLQRMVREYETLYRGR